MEENNTRVCADELRALSNSSTVSGLERESKTSGSIKESLNSFIEGSELSGQGWETVKSKLGLYVSAFDKGKQISSELSAAIAAAIEKLNPFFENYDSLDPSNLPELRQTLQELESTLASLPKQVVTSYTIDSKGVKHCVYGDNPLIPEYQAQINDVKEFIQVLEAFEKACNEVLASLQGIFSEIDSYSSEVSNITPSKIFSYSPATA